MNELKILLGWSACTFLLCGGLLWVQQHSGDRSRLYLSWTWIFAGLAFLVRLVAAETGKPVDGRILPAENLGGGLLLLMMLYLYPLEAICSGWLTHKRMALFLLPGVVLGSLQWLLLPFSRELQSFSDIWVHIGEFDVWFRVLILFLCISFYAVLLFFIPYNWMKSHVYHRWIVYYSLKVLLISGLFILFMLTGSALVSSIHLAVCIAFAVIVTYQELFVRFEMPQHASSALGEAETQGILPDVPPDEKSSPLVARIRYLMDEEQIWRNPDLDLTSLASLLNTNRNYLSKAIQEAGYKNFSDMINRRRISEFLKTMDTGQLISVQDTFFRVGFRSRETALRCFKKYVGVSPTDYMRTRIAPVETEAQ